MSFIRFPGSWHLGVLCRGEGPLQSQVIQLLYECTCLCVLVCGRKNDTNLQERIELSSNYKAVSSLLRNDRVHASCVLANPHKASVYVRKGVRQTQKHLTTWYIKL